VRCEEPLHWIVPNVITADTITHPLGRGAFRLRAREELLAARVEITQGGRPLGECRLWRVMAGRSSVLDGAWLGQVDPAGPAIVVRVRAGRPRTRPGRHSAAGSSAGNVR